MNFKEYQKKAITTLRTNHNIPELDLARLTLGLVGESGEVAEKVKKFLRDSNKKKQDWNNLAKILEKELGDVMWYIASIAYWMNLDLDDIVNYNILKLASRKKRGKIKGSGDER